MKRMYFLISVSIGTLIYVLVSLFFGAGGLWAESRLIKQRNLLSENVREIQKINDELELEYTALLEDPEVIASYARNLGFVKEGEHIVRFTGGAKLPEKIYSTGSYYDIEKIQFIPEWICKVLGISVFALCLVLFFLLDLNKKKVFNHVNNTVEVASVNS